MTTPRPADRSFTLTSAVANVFRELLHRAGAAVLLVCLLAAVAGSAGCASSPDRVLYTSISAAVDAVQSSLRVFNVAYQSGAASEADRDKVLAAYAKFQTVALAAERLGQNSANGDEGLKLVTDAAAEAIGVIEALSKRSALDLCPCDCDGPEFAVNRNLPRAPASGRRPNHVSWASTRTLAPTPTAATPSRPSRAGTSQGRPRSRCTPRGTA